MLTPFLTELETEQNKVGIICLGYVGLPLAITYAKNGFHVLGLDIDPRKPEAIHAGRTGYGRPARAGFVDLSNVHRVR